MKKIKNYSNKLLAFEVARLRTLYKNNPEIRDRIVKRYKLIVDEYSNRGLRWFWSDHILDKLIKADWCGEAGGSWITVKGRHICVSKDKDIGEGRKERTLFTETGKNVKVKFASSRKDLADKASSAYNYLPSKIREKSTLKNIEIYDTRGPTYRERLKQIGEKVPSEYRYMADDPIGGSYNRRNNTIRVWSGGRERVLYHELGHSIEPKRGTRSSWIKVWNTEKVTSYAEVNYREGFAEAYACYKTDLKHMKNNFPKTYKYIEEYLNG